MNRRRAVGLCVVLLFGHPRLALAHGFGQRYTLPVPLWLYVTGAAAAVACSFVIIGVAARATPVRRPRLHLRRLPWGRLLVHPAWLDGWRLCSVLMLLLVLLTGLLGNQQPLQNLAPTLVWVIWWIGLAYVSVFVGNLWTVINPWQALFVWAERLYRHWRPGRELAWRLPYPKTWGVWPGVVLFLGFAWIELVYDGAAVPAHLAVLALLYTWITWMGMWLFGAELWCRHGEAFSLVFGLLARCAPITVAVRHQRIWYLRSCAAGLLRRSVVSTSEMVLVLVLLATVTFDGLRVTPLWAHLEQLGEAWLPLLGGMRLMVIRTLGLLACPTLFLILYLACCWGMARASDRRHPVGEIARIFSVTLLPIAVAYHISHYLPFLLVQGQYLISLLSDPFGFGWDLLGTASYRPRLDLVGAQFAWYTAVLAIVAGHMLAVYVAHRLALRTWHAPRMARRSQYPMVGVMLGYTMASLWLLAQPIVEHQDSSSLIARSPAARVDVPHETFLPELGSGRLRAVGTGVSAAAQLTYHVLTSTFHDGTRMSVADLLYPYIFAYRWSASSATDTSTSDPYVARATALLRQRLVGLRVQRVERSAWRMGDFTLARETPVIEVYVNATDPQYASVLAPPWSSLPWHLIVLMEAAVERGWAAFSAEAAQRRGVPWLDLVRLPQLQVQWMTLLEDWARQSYVPDVLQRLVTPQEAQQRWTTLHTFAQTHGHFLVTNGPYRLSQWSEAAVVLQVFRDPSYPLGVGSYDRYALPHRAYITQVIPRAYGLEVRAEVERVERFMRTYEIVREPLRTPAGARSQDEIPLCRYVVVSPDGTVAQTGAAPYVGDGVFRVELRHDLVPGLYTVLLALYLNDNAVAPEITTMAYRVPS